MIPHNRLVTMMKYYIFMDILTKDEFNFNNWNEKGNILSQTQRGKNAERWRPSREITYI